ncbi:efflux RND transporter periplasmic adaptor subunit [Sorangium sp. So ce131]|uniref:efflux RND transporter periplasmic adaptor subunit n=1 Tax=Sorangium sp. So ce131 TaxID=3133282 RepID=UPI003F5D8718
MADSIARATGRDPLDASASAAPIGPEGERAQPSDAPPGGARPAAAAPAPRGGASVRSPRAAGGPSTGAGRQSLEQELSRVGAKRWLGRLGAVAAIAAIIAAVVVWRIRTRPPPPPRYVAAEVTTGDVLEVVQSTGQVKPLTEVQVGAQVSGRITKVYVDFNSLVKAGDVLAEIDPTLFGAQIDSNQAQLEAANASVVRAEASLATSKQRLDRAKKLVAEGVGSQADLDTAQGAYDVALADLAASKAQVAQLRAVLRSSTTNLQYTRIFSPIDGVVINRAIDPGQTVAASFQAPTLFVIAQDLRKMRVLADIDEADVGRLREGMEADVSVDAFPGETFRGKVSQVRYSPLNQSGVVTYAAVVEVDNPEVKLRPGMTATVSVRSAEARGVRRLPNAALRFKPAPERDKDGKEIKAPPLEALPPKKGRVYVLTDATPGAEKIEPRVVDVGITDGVFTALTTDLGPLKVVTDETDDPSRSGRGRGPRLF